MLTTTDLPQRLRGETADSHRSAETALGLPETVRSLADYARLLALLGSFHRGVEAALADVRWQADWTGVDVILVDHDRSKLIDDDLRLLDARPAAKTEPTSVSATAAPELASFGEALGLLYVVEGSALGGRHLGPLIRSALGDVPTRFYDSDGRGHPRPWRSVQAALRSYEVAGGDPAPVLAGAHAAFASFGERLASPLWSSR